MTVTPERKLFKDWFDAASVRTLADQVARAWPAFDRRRFVRLANRDLTELELSGRVQKLSDALRATLPTDVPEALAVLTASLPPARTDCEAVSGGWLQWPVGQFIADHGVDHLDASMAAMVELTKRFTAEFAVRPFLERHPEQIFARLEQLTSDPNPHVRRWCSEGTRPRLPWGRRLHALVDDPSPIWPIVEALKDDPEAYVRRSVANNLNDIARSHPDLVIRRCRAWREGADAHREGVVKHALRSLIKAGDARALALLGYAAGKGLTASLRVSPRRVRVGETVELHAEIRSGAARAQPLLIDYAVHYVRKGDKASAKVFKWKTERLPARDTLVLRKRHAMKTTTIRALYPGAHRVELQVNGVRVAEATFDLVAANA